MTPFIESKRNWTGSRWQAVKSSNRFPCINSGMLFSDHLASYSSCIQKRSSVVLHDLALHAIAMAKVPAAVIACCALYDDAIVSNRLGPG